MKKTEETKASEEQARREKMKRIASEHIERGDFYGWFERIYRETENDSEQIPWVDFAPNRFLVEWNETARLEGMGKNALVVGCGLGDEAKFLDELDFKVTAFDVSAKAVEIARRIHASRDINFVNADLFDAPEEWLGKFKFVLEVYTIQALPLDLREKTIERIAGFVAPEGELVVVQRFREAGEKAEGLPWALSAEDLKIFEKNGLTLESFSEFLGDEEEIKENGKPIKRFVAKYKREKD